MMMTAINESLNRGLRSLQLHSHLFLVVVLVFLLPFSFLYVNKMFFDAATANVNTAEKQRVSILHDSLALLLSQTNGDAAALIPALETYTRENEDILEIAIAKEVEGGYQVLASLAQERVTTVETDNFLFNSALGDQTKSLIIDDTTAGYRQWHAVRKIKLGTDTFYIESSHTLERIDDTLRKRQQESYLFLTPIFALLMGLAYWLARQIHWHAETVKLEKVLEERNLFTNMIAHEFRAPLTAINGYASFLSESKSIQGDETRYVENIQTSAQRLIALVNDFLEVARIQSGKLALKKEEVEIQTVLAAVVDTLRSSALEKRLTLSYEPSKLPLTMYTDPNRLTQILTNIVSNSIKYTEMGAVTITAEKNPIALTIRIKDTGMGISADDQQKLFAPFVRVGGVEDTKTVGTGLGMWITKQLVELLGGSIGVESIKGVGTHIVLTFKLRGIAS